VLSQTLLPVKSGRGRVAAVEVMVGTAAIRNLIREGKTHLLLTTIQSGSREGMQTLNQGLRELVKNQMVSFETALAHSSNPQELAQLCGREGVSSAAL
jgi:twitching motility protein PilT